MKSGSDWDAYAPFYDWENARTFGRRDIAFWRRVVHRESGRVLELGCGTGRLLLPLARAGAKVVGIDRSEAMLSRGRARAARLSRRSRPAFVLGDVRALPFRPASFDVVLASYGLLQSLLSPGDLGSAIRAAARVLRRGGLFGVDLVPDLPAWAEYGNRLRLEGRRRDGTKLTLVESVRQDRRRGLTVFREQFTEGTTRTRRFSLTFRTEPLPRTIARLRRAGFQVESMLGDYRGSPLTVASEAWLILARKR